MDTFPITWNMFYPKVFCRIPLSASGLRNIWSKSCCSVLCLLRLYALDWHDGCSKSIDQQHLTHNSPQVSTWEATLVLVNLMHQMVSYTRPSEKSFLGTVCKKVGHLAGDWTDHLRFTVYHGITSTNQINSRIALPTNTRRERKTCFLSPVSEQLR